MFTCMNRNATGQLPAREHSAECILTASGGGGGDDNSQAHSFHASSAYHY